MSSGFSTGDGSGVTEDVGVVSANLLPLSPYDAFNSTCGAAGSLNEELGALR